MIYVFTERWHRFPSNYRFNYPLYSEVLKRVLKIEYGTGVKHYFYFVLGIASFGSRLLYVRVLRNEMPLVNLYPE